MALLLLFLQMALLFAFYVPLEEKHLYVDFFSPRTPRYVLC